MRQSIDDILCRIFRRTHSPRGQYAATPQTYQSLLDRIPAEQRPVMGQSTQSPTLGPRVQSRRSSLPRWNVAASLLLLAGIGLAIAGIWYHQYYQGPASAEDLSVSEPSNTQAEPRTLIYEQAPLTDITSELSEIFHTPIQIVSPDLRDYRITATFRTDEPLDDILSILAEIGPFEVHETPEGFVIE